MKYMGQAIEKDFALERAIEAYSRLESLTNKITRVEVIDSSGRAYIYCAHEITVEQQLQDGGKTLKIFIK